MPKLPLCFADQDGVSSTADENKTLLEGARNNRLALASDCEMGDCQTCLAKLIEPLPRLPAGLRFASETTAGAEGRWDIA